ncbi:MAG: nucleotidyltransferase family protein [Phycisphaerales bacterium]|nr:nucleotidyltransferase family protein [Phycisphaerales bacterium]
MTSSTARVRIGCIVPAAGMSRRMGRPKATLPFGGSTVVGRVVRSLLDADADEILVVTRSELAPQLELPHDRRVTVAFNDDADSEMIDSVRIGLAVLRSRIVEDGRAGGPGRQTWGTDSHESSATSNRRPTVDDRPLQLASGGILVVPADMPAVTADSYRKCFDAFRLDPGRIVIAACRGRRGHPIIFPISLAPDLDRLTGG